MDDLEKLVRDELTRLFEEDKAVERVYKRIKQGVATYEDAHQFSLALGKMLRKSFSDMVDAIPEGMTAETLQEIADAVVYEALTQNYKLSSLVCETIQYELNSMADLGIKAIEPKVDKSRIDAIVEAFTNSKSKEAMKVALGEPVITYAQTVVDDWVKANADFQKQSGVEPIIARKWSGRYSSHDTKHTDWCKDLEGIWEYGDQPPRTFARHEGCTCTVLYYPNKKAMGRVTALAKGEKDTDQVLWNTGEVFSNSRKAVLRRRRQMYGKEEARRILNEEWKGGFNGNAERHFE